MNNCRLRFGLIGLIVSVLMVSSHAWANVQLDARLDRSSVVEGEAVTLTITASGNVSEMPDFSPLQQDFEILSRGQSSNFSMVNGQVSNSISWHLTLSPKATGNLQIPALHLANASSRTLSLQVLPVGQAPEGSTPLPVMLEAEVDQANPLVQSQVVYTVRVLSRVSLRRGNLSPPEAADAIIERMGDERRYEMDRGGFKYLVTERRYAIFPQHSGELSISPPVLNAQVVADAPSLSSRGDPFARLDGFFDSTKPVRMRAQNITLDVQAQPANAPSPWLPARALNLREEWPQGQPKFRVGEPITRSLVLTAVGLSSTQLPTIQVPAPAGMTSYPDQAQSTSRVVDDAIESEKIFKFALLPSVAGDITLPAVELAWWDVSSAKPQVARIPARTIKVLPSATPNNQTLVKVPPVSPTPATLPVPMAPQSERDELVEAAAFWPWLSLGLAFAWLSTLALWWRGSRARKPLADAPVQAVVQPPSTGAAIAALRKACAANQAGAAREALLAWAQAAWQNKPPQTLQSLAERLGPQAAKLCAELDRQLYAGQAGAWDGPAFWQAIQGLLKVPAKAAQTAKQPALPGLYAR